MTIDRNIDVDHLTDDDILGTTQGRYSGRGSEQRLLDLLVGAKELRRRFAGKQPEEVAAELGVDGDEEMLAVIDALLSSRFYAPSLMEGRKSLLSSKVQTKIRLMVTEAVAEALELDERWREDDEAEWHQSISGSQQALAAKPANIGAKIVTQSTQAPEASGAAVQKARQLVAMTAQMVARKNPVMARHIATLATQFEDLVKQPSEANNRKALQIAGQISSLAKSISE